jgi:2-amino-4-hydroxy-6-hydroxymethyldihydropteridine diphosphokinase
MEALKKEVGKLTAKSSLYTSEAWGFRSEDLFVNAVVKLQTNKPAQEVLRLVLEIETHLGRTRKKLKGYQSRTIDIDILFYDNQIITEENLVIPHPRLHQRRFTLEPLHQIAPDLFHPVLKKSVAELLDICTDKLCVTKLEN